MTDESNGPDGTEASRRDFMKTGALASGALAVGTGVAVASGDDAQDENEDEQETADTAFATVEFVNQESDGEEVVVDETTLSDPGYVAFHDATLFQGAVVESVVGVTDRQESGVHYEVDADLFDVPGAEFEQEGLEGTTPLVAMPHRETGGDDEYNFVSSGGEEDGPFAEAGLPVVDLAFVTATDGAGMSDESGDDMEGTPEDDEDDEHEGTPEGDDMGEETPEDTAETEQQPFAAVDFENQPLDGDTVTVGEAILSDGGFVTLHDARLFEGQTIPSVVGVSDYLEPGRHRSIEVTIDNPDEVAEVPFPPALPLVPMPHFDTNDNQTYDFVDTEGAEDGPYVNAGAAVVDLGFVTREEGTATPTETDGA